MQGFSWSDVEISVIPNELEKYMAFTINKDLVFIESMKFMNSSLDILVKHLPVNDLKHLSQKFDGERLRLANQKRSLFI